MPLSSKSIPKTFNLLSIGQRGVGKTVFLAGSYAELQGDAELEGTDSLKEAQRTNRADHPRSVWIECEDEEVQLNLEKILRHVEQTGLYPPPTIKITNFNFQLKQQTVWGLKTLCHFRWWDIPGESCTIRNPDFQDIVLTSHGCCVFISAVALVHDQEYAHTLEDIFNQLIAIATVVQEHRLNYAFAIILTKCDLLEPGTVTQMQVEQNLQPLLMRLNSIKANYQRFYSAIPIVSIKGTSRLNARGAADPLLWLLAELNKHHHFQPQQDLATGLAQHAFAQQVFPSYLRRSIVMIAIAGTTILGIFVSLLFASGLFNNPPDQSPAQEKRLN